MVHVRQAQRKQRYSEVLIFLQPEQTKSAKKVTKVRCVPFEWHVLYEYLRVIALVIIDP